MCSNIAHTSRSDATYVRSCYTNAVSTIAWCKCVIFSTCCHTDTTPEELLCKFVRLAMKLRVIYIYAMHRLTHICREGINMRVFCGSRDSKCYTATLMVCVQAIKSVGRRDIIACSRRQPSRGSISFSEGTSNEIVIIDKTKHRHHSHLADCACI